MVQSWPTKSQIGQLEAVGPIWKAQTVLPKGGGGGGGGPVPLVFPTVGA